MVLLRQDRDTQAILEAVRTWCQARGALDRARTDYLRHGRTPAQLEGVHCALVTLDQAVTTLAHLACD